MADADELPDPEVKRRLKLWPRRKRFQFLFVLLVLLLVSSFLSWRARDNIAEDLITSQLEALGIEASYEIESVGITRQVLRNFVVGDPENPDLTIERVELVPVVRITGADIGTLTLIRPRLRATYRDGELSLGALDPVFEIETDGPARLPGWSLSLVDAQGRIETDYGVAGFKADGAGRLSGGFHGVAALVAPPWDMDSCEWSNAQLVGELRTSRGQAYFNGPLEVTELSCPDQNLRLPKITARSSLQTDEDLVGASGTLALNELDVSVGDLRTAGLSGSFEFDWSGGLATGRYSFGASEFENTYGEVKRPAVDGGFRVRTADFRWEMDANLSGSDLALGEGSQKALGSAASAGEGTLIEPILDRFRAALEDGLRSSSLQAKILARQSSDGVSLVVPEARIRDRDRRAILSVSQGQWASDKNGVLRLAGNLSLDRDGLPQIQGRMESTGAGAPALRFRMAPYRAGASELAVPQMQLTQFASGSWQLSGEVIASGAIPGGSVEQLQLPIEGGWSDAGGLALWKRCADLRFEQLKLADLKLESDIISVCPDKGSAIVRSGSTGTQVSARIDSLQLQGQLGDSPIRLGSRQFGFSDVEGLLAHDVRVELGEPEAQSELTIAEFAASFSEETSGTFTGLSGGLDAVPLDIEAGQGNWRFAEGALTLTQTRFDLLDREEDQRFERLTARDAQLTLADNRINASTLMRHPGTDRLIVAVDLVHDLTSGIGHADLDVPGIIFDDQLEPGARIDQCDDSFKGASGPTGLTCLATGVIALAEGVVKGNGRIDWSPENVQSSGTFSTDAFDFAAAFGPVRDVSGTVRFSDLISLTTDGTQQLAVGTIDPGVEVYNGVLDFALINGSNVSLRGGRWPFFGGTMLLRPTELNFAASEERSYVIEITGVDAAQFIAAMEFSNISASGTFDGTVPLVFDEMGNGEIINGLLISRPPGGNLSYVGELTYEDTGAIANYAFRSLRSLDFNQMMVEMNGPLTGEIITRLLFDGVSQGADADRNFITRQIAKLPIRFNVNVRASFYQLMNDLLKTYDPATHIDPASLGLIRGANGRMVRPSILEKSAPAEGKIEQDEPSIQTQESETLP